VTLTATLNCPHTSYPQGCATTTEKVKPPTAAFVPAMRVRVAVVWFPGISGFDGEIEIPVGKGPQPTNNRPVKFVRVMVIGISVVPPCWTVTAGAEPVTEAVGGGIVPVNPSVLAERRTPPSVGGVYGSLL
jgi:hypothetical protein